MKTSTKERETAKKLKEAKFNLGFIKAELDKIIELVDKKSVVSEKLKKLKTLL